MAAELVVGVSGRREVEPPAPTASPRCPDARGGPHVCATHARPRSLTQVLAVRPLVALHVEQGVAVVKDFGPGRTLRVVCGLTVPGHQEAVIDRRGAWGTHGSWQPIGAWGARKPSRTCKTEEE